MSTPTPTPSKLPLQSWLSLFTSRGVDMRTAMSLAGKLYTQYPTAESLGKLNGPGLMAAGFGEKDVKKSLMAALKGIKASLQPATAGPSQSKEWQPPKKRRRDPQGDLENPLLPTSSKRRKDPQVDSFDFNEVYDIEELRQATCETNRAPCLTAWAYIIAEKMGFERVEALSLASVYTSITSTHHALSLGNIYTTDRERREAEEEVRFVPGGNIRGSSGKGKGREGEGDGDGGGGFRQPWVGLMGRKPVIELANGKWAGLTKGVAVGPEKAHSYITRNFGPATPHVLGALRLLARCYDVEELNERGYGMYVSFRPEVEQWGERATLYVSNIIDMIPPEAEVDLAVYGGLRDTGAAGGGDRVVVMGDAGLAGGVTKTEEGLKSIKDDPDEDSDLSPPPPEPEQEDIKPFITPPLPGQQRGVGGGFEPSRTGLADGEDVFEGLFEAGWEDDAE